MPHLDRHTILESHDLDELRACFAQEVGRHDVDLLGPDRDLDARVCAAPLAELPLFHTSYGRVAMEIGMRDLVEDAFLLAVPTSGGGHVHQGREAGIMSRDRALVRDMRRPVSLQQVDFGSFVLKVPRSRLLRLAEALHGPGAADAGLSFNLTTDLRTPQGRHLHDTIHFLAEQLNGTAGAISPLTAAIWEDLLLTQMLSAVPNSLEGFAARAPRSGALPYYVKRARDFIHDHAQERIGLADLVQAAGCSLRTLQAAFAETTGLPPMAYLKAVRLERAHRDLRTAGPGATVAAIARRWGFGHLGRFAGDYRRRYGCTPTETLRNGG